MYGCFVTGLTETKKMTTFPPFNSFGPFATKFENNERKAIVKLRNVELAGNTVFP